MLGSVRFLCVGFGLVGLDESWVSLDVVGFAYVELIWLANVKLCCVF
jgi:hypothetical protein